VAPIARELVDRCRVLTSEINRGRPAPHRAHAGPPPSRRASLARPPTRNGDGGLEALRVLKRRLSGVYRALRTDATLQLRPTA
jgi:hypothetical protein